MTIFTVAFQALDATPHTFFITSMYLDYKPNALPHRPTQARCPIRFQSPKASQRLFASCILYKDRSCPQTKRREKQNEYR
jgi:hypothetical protein